VLDARSARAQAGACGCKCFGKCRTKKTQGVCVMWGASTASTHNQDEHYNAHTHAYSATRFCQMAWCNLLFCTICVTCTHRRLHDVCCCV